MSLEDRVALVTGATRGIGRAIALELGKVGAIVAGTATTLEGAENIKQLFQAEKVAGTGYVLNVCDEKTIEAALTAIRQEFGDPAILVNNAAITQDNLLLRMKPEQWNSVIDTNLNSLYRVTKSCLKPMVKSRWGRIVNISSVVGLTGNPGQTNYSASKAGLLGFSKSLAQEIASFGITVNVVAPGFIETDMTEKISDKYKEVIHKKIPLGRIGKPEEVASAVLFLVSDSAAYITGQTIHVNGGMYMG